MLKLMRLYHNCQQPGLVTKISRLFFPQRHKRILRQKLEEIGQHFPCFSLTLDLLSHCGFLFVYPAALLRPSQFWKAGLIKRSPNLLHSMEAVHHYHVNTCPTRKAPLVTVRTMHPSILQNKSHRRKEQQECCNLDSQIWSYPTHMQI